MIDQEDSLPAEERSDRIEPSPLEVAGSRAGGLGWLPVAFGRWVIPLVAVLIAASATALVTLIGVDSPATWGLALGPLLGAVDSRVRRLPTVLIWASGLAAFAAAVVTPDGMVLMALLGLLSGVGFYGAIWFAAPGGIGFGDVRLAGLIGLSIAATHGFLTAATSLLVAPLLAVVMLPLVRLLRPVPGSTSRPESMPFGLPLIVSALCFAVAGPDLAMGLLSP